MLSEAVNFCGTSRHGCRADHEQAAAGNDPLDSPGTVRVRVPALSMQSWLVWANFYMIMVCVRIMPFHLPFSMSLKGQIDNNFSSGLRRVTVLSSKQCQERRGKKFGFPHIRGRTDLLRNSSSSRPVWKHRIFNLNSLAYGFQKDQFQSSSPLELVH